MLKLKSLRKLINAIKVYIQLEKDEMAQIWILKSVLSFCFLKEENLNQKLLSIQNQNHNKLLYIYTHTDNGQKGGGVQTANMEYHKISHYHCAIT